MRKIIHLFLLCAVLFPVMGCTGNKDADAPAHVSQDKFSEALDTRNIERILHVVDSLEQAGVYTSPQADLMRAIGYDRCWQMRLAEHFYKKSYEAYCAAPAQDWYRYADSGYRWAYLRFARGDTQGSLSVITELLQQAKESEAFPAIVEAALLMLMSDIQIQLHQFDEAQISGQKAYEAVQRSVQNGNQSSWDIAWGCMHMALIHHQTGDIEGALAWLDRCAEGIALAEQKHEDSLVIEEWKGHIALQRATFLQESGCAAEAAAIYAAIPRSRLMEPNGYTAAADYLMAAGRYDEAAYWYEQVDSTYRATDGAKMTFDIIATRLSPRYTAYRKAGRNADALILADSVSAAIDSALAWQKQNDAAELAVIYQTHEKELALNDARSETRIHRLLLVAALLVILLIGYLFWRARQYNKVLFDKNCRLMADIEQREQERQLAIEQLKAEPETNLTANQQLFRRICDLMDGPDHIYTDTDLDRNRLAQLLGTNEHYVTDAISTCTKGKNVNSFLNEYRLRYAAHLLASTTDAVTIIAELSGFSRSSFFRVFSDAYGMSPSEYRRVVGK